MSALDVLDNETLHGAGQVAGVLGDILEVAKEQIDGGASKQDILCAVLFGFDIIVKRHWKESHAAWKACTKMLELLNACDANAEQKGFLVVLGCLVDEKNIDKMTTKMAQSTEHFSITKDAAARALPSAAAAEAAAAAAAAAAASLERGQKKRSLDQLEEMTEDDFTVEFPDLKLGRLYEHFQAMQNKVNALERTAKHAIDTLEARVVELEAQSGGE